MYEITLFILLSFTLGYTYVLAKKSPTSIVLILAVLYILFSVCAFSHVEAQVFGISLASSCIGGYLGMKQYEYYQHKHDKAALKKFMS